MNEVWWRVLVNVLTILPIVCLMGAVVLEFIAAVLSRWVKDNE